MGTGSGSCGAARAPPATPGQGHPNRAGGSSPHPKPLGTSDSRGSTRGRTGTGAGREPGQAPPSAAKPRERIWGFPRLRVPALPSCLPREELLLPDESSLEDGFYLKDVIRRKSSFNNRASNKEKMPNF